MQHDVRAEIVLQRSLALCQSLVGRDASCASNPLVNLGVFARDRGDNVAAEAYYRRAFAIRAPLVGADNPDLIPLLNNLANVYHAVGDDARALATHFQALTIEEKALAPYHRYALLTAGQHRDHQGSGRGYCDGDRISASYRSNRREAARTEYGGRLGAAETRVRARRV